MIYLDNAATSYPKPDVVYEEIEKCMRTYCANPGRGGHTMSITAAKAVVEAREIISKFFNIDNPLRLCFTKNATEALNTAIKGHLKPGDHVITTSMEHNSVIRPLKALEKQSKIELTIVKGKKYGQIDIYDIVRNIKKSTAMVACTLSSNVNGVIMPIYEIGKVTRERGIAFLVDAAQGAGCVDVDVKKMNIDMLAFPGHKGLMGPQGTGGLYVREDIKVTPLMEGGTGSNSESFLQPEFMPDLLESGTINTPGIIGLGYGIRFINSMGRENIKYFKHLLLERLYEGLRDIKGVKLYSSNDKNKNSGIIALNIKEMDSTEVSYILDKKYRIATRAGLHCAPLAHKTLNTLKTGVVRLSLGCFNTVNEIDLTIDAIRKIAERKGG